MFGLASLYDTGICLAPGVGRGISFVISLSRKEKKVEEVYSGMGFWRSCNDSMTASRIICTFSISCSIQRLEFKFNLE